MGLLELVVVLIVWGVLLYIVSMIPMDPTIKKIIPIVVTVVILLWVVNGLFGPFHDIQLRQFDR